MPLSNYKPRSEVILAGDESIPIYPLTVSDIGTLVLSYGEDCRRAYDIYKTTEGIPDISDRVNRTLVEVVNLIPDLTAAIIALAAREPSAMEQAKSLPFIVQVDALVKVTELTIGSEGGLGNFLAVVQRAANTLKSVSPQNEPPRPSAIQ